MIKKDTFSTTILYPQVEVAQWAEQWSLTLESYPCANCGMLQSPTIPFASKNWRGLIAPVHGCGENYRLTRAREADPKESAEWKKLFWNFKRLLSESLSTNDNVYTTNHFFYDK